MAAIFLKVVITARESIVIIAQGTRNIQLRH